MRGAFSKTAINVAAHRNWLRLTALDRAFLVSSAQINRFFISPEALDKAFVPKDARLRLFKFNVVNFGRIGTRPVGENVKFRFISEILREGKPYTQTELFKFVASGNSIRRRGILDQQRDSASGHYRQRVAVGAEEFCWYYDTVMALVESIRRHGFLDVEYGEGEIERKLRLELGPKARGSAISVAIDADGGLLHYTKGHHRLAIARELGVRKVPVAVHFVSGTYFRRFVRVHDLISEAGIMNAIRQAADHAISSVEGADVRRPGAREERGSS